MDSQTALKLTYLEDNSDDLSVSSRLRLAKEIFSNNNNNNNSNTNFSLSDQDINLMEMFELLDLTERENGIIYISQFYHACYSDYNISIGTLGESLPSSAIDRLIKMYGILRSHGLLKFLFANGEVVPIEEFKRIINEQ